MRSRHAAGSVLLLAASLLALGPTGCGEREPSAPSRFQAQAPPRESSPTPSSESGSDATGAGALVQWRFTLHAVPRGTEIGPDGLVAVTGALKPASQASIPAGAVEAAKASIEALPGATLVANPMILARTGTDARIELTEASEGPAGTMRRAIGLRAELGEGAYDAVLELESSLGGSSTSCRSGAETIVDGGALLMLCPGPMPEQPWLLLVATPTRAAADSETP